ncbi:hypothetical protein [Streptomyces sp. MA15]|uniref:hypothetical protein n=1 Tax=Streptomyces sp. MA15 TaxID=3055061 RepID=UPI0025B03E46|nr:hypothetical protein [Streptomyces sp. MA15]MDN3270242.1 hypothetical protein [Streptomyces sp. MA15]
MEQDTSRASELPQPLRAVASHLRRLPGAGQVGKAAGTALDTLGAVSPRGRRIAVYTGAGVLGVAGLVEWPVAVTGAAVAWLTRPRDEREAAAGDTPEAPAGDGGGEGDGEEAWAAATREGGAPAPAGAEADAARRTSADASGDHRPPAGPGDRLTPTRHRPGGEPAPHVQPAKVGDEGTASALRKVAAATGHDDAPGRPGHGRRSG